MSKGRAAPPPAETEHTARRAALIVGTPDAVREWARRYNIPLIACDDATLLNSIHDARSKDDSIPAPLRAASRRWIQEHT